MSKRRNLDDAIWGDRDVIRSYHSSYDKLAACKTSSDFVGERCYKNHPPLKLPGTQLVIYGGSCLSPAVADADIYIGFDAGMKLTSNQYPWNGSTELLYTIRDMGVPSSIRDYRKLLEWTRGHLEAGKKVHCGCIGGHGRTGMFLAALVSEFGEKDAIRYVRQHYCKKAVESAAQTSFLEKNFGINSVAGSKSGVGAASKQKGSSKVVDLKKGAARSFKRYSPLPNNGCIWEEPCN